MNNKIGVIVQARMESSRLPGKVLMPLNGVPALERMIDRIKYLKSLKNIIVASPNTKENDKIKKLCMRKHILFSTPDVDPEDVLSRVYSTAKAFQLDTIISLTADCPLIDSRQILYLLSNYNTGKYDYVSNVVERSFFDGADVEIFSFDALHRVYHEVDNPIHRSHVGFNIMIRPYQFKLWNWLAPDEYHYPEWRLTLDEKEDYELINHIFTYFKDKPNFSYIEIMDYLKSNMQLLEINKNVRTKNPNLEK
jgi:spore coat polysaccharide biosynthesis protein SpsF